MLKLPKIILKKKKVGGVSLPRFQDLIATVIKTVWGWHKDRRENLEVCPSDFWQRCLGKSEKHLLQ